MLKAAGNFYRIGLVFAAASAGLAQQYSISTIAGGAPPATPVTATSVSIGQPRRVTADKAGNVYFSSQNTVFKIAGGALTVVAGNSRPGFSGDGGAAVAAQLNSPEGLAVDAAGNVYIADSLNNRVRVVDSKGIIRTFAGNGDPGTYGAIHDGGQATAGNLNMPSGVAVDASGNVYIADTGHHAVRKVNPAGFITSIAGDTYPGFAGTTNNGENEGLAKNAELRLPQDVAVDSSGNVFIADTGNARIRRIGTDNLIYTVAGNSTIAYGGDGAAATKASLIEPFAVAVDSAGNVYIAEVSDSRLRMVGTNGEINTISGRGFAGFGGDGGAAPQASFSFPTGVAADSSNNVYIADTMNFRVRKISGGSAGTMSTIAGNGVFSYSGDGGRPNAAQFNAPEGVAVNATGIYISDTGNNVVRKITGSPADGVLSTLAGNGTAGFGGDGGKGTSAQLNAPVGLAVDASGNVFVADSQNHRVRKIAADGAISTYAGNGTAGFAGDGAAAANAQINTPYGVALDKSGNLYIAEFGGNRVRKVTAAGVISTVAGNGVAGYSGDGGQAASAMLNGPRAVAVDAAGNVFIADSINYRVRVVTPTGTISTYAGNGNAGWTADGGQAAVASITSPSGLAVDPLGNLFIASGGTRIRKVYPWGVITTAAGSGERGYSGDGGLATAAKLNGALSLAADDSGSVYMAETGNNAVRALSTAGFGMSIAAVTNSASNQVGAIAPGEIVTIYGSGIGPSNLVTMRVVNGVVTTELAGVSVYFNGVAAPMVYASATQVAAIAPFSLTGDTTQVFVRYNEGTTAPVSVGIVAAAPAIYTLDSTGRGVAAAIINGSNAVNSSANPVKPGEWVSLYITGAGRVNPPVADGTLGATPLPQVVQQVTATVGGQNAEVNYAGGASGLVAGAVQVNVKIPAGTPVGAATVLVTVGGVSTQSGVALVVGN